MTKFTTRKEQKIFEMIADYGGVDGAHHKQWVLDQCLRILLSHEGYKSWKYECLHKGFEWDEGIAP